MRSLHQIFLFLLQIVLFFHTFADGTTIRGLNNYKEPNPRPKTGVELDQPLARSTDLPDLLEGGVDTIGKLRNRLVFTAHWSNTGTLTPGQLFQIAKDGYMDMLKSAKLYRLPTDRIPSVMTVFHWGDEIILASSQKGGRALTYTEDSDFLALVKACIGTANKSNEAKCGEMTAGQIYQKLHPSTPMQSARITTVTVIKDAVQSDKMKSIQLKIHPPCSKADGGGCDKTVGPDKILAKEVPVGTEAEPWSSTGWQRTPANSLSFAAPTQ